MHREFKTRFILSLALTLGLLSVLSLALFLVMRDINKQSSYVNLTKSDLKTRVRQLDSLVRLREEAKLAEPELPKLEQALPKKDELFVFRRQLDDLARQNNLTLGFNFGEEKAGDLKGLKSINFDMTLHGDKDNILSFIKKIESGITFIKLKSFDMIRQENGFSASLKGEVLYNE